MVIRDDFDVIVIGSGPAGVAVTERLYSANPLARICVIERGRRLLRRHFYSSGRTFHERAAFLAQHLQHPWDGDLKQGGALLYALGGRGIVGGGQLHRFYECDLSLWDDSLWPVTVSDLAPYFDAAEDRLLGDRRIGGEAQESAVRALQDFGPRHPPVAASNRLITLGLDQGIPYRSSAERLSAIEHSDRRNGANRLRIMSETVALRLIGEDSAGLERVGHVLCASASSSSLKFRAVHGRFFVLAASPIESARLLLASSIHAGKASMVGRYLSEHVYARGYLSAGYGAHGIGPVNLYLPPAGSSLDERFQIEIRSVSSGNGTEALLRVTGSAAMDPSPDNLVTLSRELTDEFGVPLAETRLRLSPADEIRVRSMMEAIENVRSLLNGKWAVAPKLLTPGSSYHEAGTIRSLRDDVNGGSDSRGLVHGTTNTYVGDGAAFPTVGVANPILTITAMGYRLGDNLASRTAEC